MIKVLGSNSSGNCYLIETENETLILEAGINFKTVLKKIDFNLAKVVGVLISHCHSDHAKYTKEFEKNSIQIYAPDDVLNKHKVSLKKGKSILAKDRFKVGGFDVIVFNNYHTNADGTDCTCLGFLIKHKEIGKILFATDTFKIKPKFNDVDYMMLECNYSYNTIDENDSEEKILRNLKSHMSLETLKKLLNLWDLTGTKEILLIHLSEGNSNPGIFRTEIEELTGIKTTIAKKGVVICNEGLHK